MNLSDEWYLYTRLKMRGLAGNTFDGITEYDQRKERVRAAIKQADIGTLECWTLKGHSESFADAFYTVYGEKL